MPHTEWLIPRPVLFNAALYSFSALIYTVTLFSLEAIDPYKYVFDPQTPWRNRFSYLAICSWPILLFGALILIAVRIGSRSRKRSNSKKKKAKRKAKKRKEKQRNKPLPPSTIPPSQQQPQDLPTYPPPVSTTPLPLQQPPPPPRNNSATTTGSTVKRIRSSRSGRRRSVPRGYVSVTRPQRIFAAFGFLWVAIGLICTSACGGLVFVGQRDRYKLNAQALGSDDGWKSVLIPLITGGLPLLVYAIMAVSSLFKIYTTFNAKGRIVETPAASIEDDDDIELAKADAFDVDVVFETPEGYPTPGENRTEFGNTPDNRTVERLMQQLRDMGFRNPHQNMAALQASSFDLEMASVKLANAQM